MCETHRMNYILRRRIGKDEFTCRAYTEIEYERVTNQIVCLIGVSRHMSGTVSVFGTDHMIALGLHRLDRLEETPE